MSQGGIRKIKKNQIPITILRYTSFPDEVAVLL